MKLKRTNKTKKNRENVWSYFTSGYITALSGPGDRYNQPNSEKVLGKHEHTYQEAEIASTGFAAANKDAKKINAFILGLFRHNYYRR